jgi:cardiolipin synthase A/B
MLRNFFKNRSARHIEFLIEGEAYYQRYLELIRSAQESIHLQTYIFEADLFGQDVISELIKAVTRGVQVYLLIDSVGSMNLKVTDSEKLIQAGVHFCRFNGFAFSWLGQWGRRLHHKVLLVDHNQAIIGGINVISSAYKKDAFPQMDFAVFVEGQITHDLARYCQFVFSKAAKNKKLFKKNKSATGPEGVSTKYGQSFDVGVSINDWVYHRWQITRQYSQLTQIAQKDILIVNSYFFPRRKFMKQLTAAARRGVRVRLILPEISDWPSYILGSQYLYAYFLKNGVEIYQWKKSILHGKLASIDNTWCTIGSFNLNYTSYQQNLEMNIDIKSADFTNHLNKKMEEIIDTGCEKINAAEFVEKASLKVRFKRFFFYLLLAILANFSVGMVFQEEKNHSRLYKMAWVSSSLVFFTLGIVCSVWTTLPASPFFAISLLLIYRQIRYNNKNV